MNKNKKTPSMPENIRTDKWKLAPTQLQLTYLQETVETYRAMVRALIGVIYVHWKEIQLSTSPCACVEKLMHRTSKNTNPRYKYFEEKFYKFPSYLRRAAIEVAIGQVSSFITRYDKWQHGIRKRRDEQPPKLTAKVSVYPALYLGQCIQYLENYQTANIKVFNGSDWVWTQVKIEGKRKRHLVESNKQLSPSLIVKGKKVHLSVPFRVNPIKLNNKKQVVASVDLGINTAATCSIVTILGTVTARLFLNLAADIDQRDRRLKLISKKASLTMGKGGKLRKGFCQSLYRKARNINQQIAQKVSTSIVKFALENNVSTLVFEHLQGFRPRGGKKSSTLRQRFHGWLHRRIVQLVKEKFLEVGGKVEFVNPANTSKYAFDGSGLVKRDKSNYSLAKFPNGKLYNSDLSASYNIAAKFLTSKFKLLGGNSQEAFVGRSSRSAPRMPVTLSSLWHLAQVVDSEAATTV
jgi:IS605 OrfB family transposase